MARIGILVLASSPQELSESAEAFNSWVRVLLREFPVPEPPTAPVPVPEPQPVTDDRWRRWCSYKVPASHWDGELAADIFRPEGEAVFAPANGWAQPMTFPLGGYTVTFTEPSGRTWYLAHLRAEDRPRGEVKRGDLLGFVSDSGNAKGRGAHIHLAIATAPDGINAKGGGNLRPSEVILSLCREG